MRALLIAAAFLSSCAGYKPGCMTVSVSQGKATVAGKTLPVVTATRGIGGKPGSRKTPIGELVVIAKEPSHRFGPILRLGGVSEDGYKQDGRGILIHRRFGAGTRGCVGLEPEDVGFVFASLDVGDSVRIIP